MTPSKRNRSVRACTECRQVKLRCNRKSKFPHQCSRCDARGLECVVDSQFRRTPARQRVERITEELRELKRTIRMVDVVQDSNEGADEMINNPNSDTTGKERIFCESTHALDGIQPATLGSCLVNEDDITILFSTYASHFYRHLPILDPSISVASIQQSNPFLFWTIIVIVAQRAPSTYSQLWSDLLEPYKLLLGQAVISSPLTLSTIQGILHICTWSLPVEFQPRDCTWNLSGIAVNAALYMGLHKPGHYLSLRSIGVFGDSPRRSITWLACFYISVRISQCIGIAPPLRSPEDIKTISDITGDGNIPSEFAALADISRCVAKYTILLSENAKSAMGSSLIGIFEQELQSTKERFSSCWNAEHEYYVLEAKLHAYGILIVGRATLSQSKRDGGTDLFTQKSHILQGLHLATQLINMLIFRIPCPMPSKRRTNRASSKEDIATTALPKFYFRAMVFATFYLLRYFVLAKWSDTGDNEVAKDHVMSAHSYLDRCSFATGDESDRVAKAIDALCTAAPTVHTVFMGQLRVNDRLAASISFDLLSTANEIRNKPALLENDQQVPQIRAKPSLTGDSEYTGQQLPREAEENSALARDIWDQQSILDLIDFDFPGVSDNLFPDAGIFG